MSLPRLYSAKACLHCKRSFSKAPKLSARQWREQRFCSVVCSARYRAGSLQQRFAAYVEDRGECLIWTGPQQYGYGVMSVGPKRPRAHRWAWEQVHGTIPEDLTLHHHCRQKLCVNVAHLELLTRSEHQAIHADGFPAAAIAAAAQINLRKTHCPHGHPYDEQNTGRSRSGSRYCKACHRVYAKRRYWARKAAA